MWDILFGGGLVFIAMIFGWAMGRATNNSK